MLYIYISCFHPSICMHWKATSEWPHESRFFHDLYAGLLTLYSSGYGPKQFHLVTSSPIYINPVRRKEREPILVTPVHSAYSDNDILYSISRSPLPIPLQLAYMPQICPLMLCHLSLRPFNTVCHAITDAHSFTAGLTFIDCPY